METTKEKKAPTVKAKKPAKTKEKPVVEKPVVDELPNQVKVIHKRSEKEFVVSRQHYLNNKGTLKIA